jgi:asparagine synthase (glutamine-hydrolysing)
VRPGAVCTIDRQLRLSEHRYWTAAELFDGVAADGIRRELAQLSEDALLDRVESSLQQAFAYRMVADVPVGVFLSGGIDSSLVAALLVRRCGFRLKTFTIGFESAEFDESTYARSVAAQLETEHQEFIVSPQSVLDTVSDVLDIADEPIGDSSLLPTLIVSRLARRHVKVALSADGADELFGGYARYAYCGTFVEQSKVLRALYWLSGDILEQLPPRMVARAYAIARGGGSRFAAINDKLRKFVRMSKGTTEFEAYDAAISEWSFSESQALAIGNGNAQPHSARVAYKSVEGVDPRDRFMHFDMTRYLPGDLLVKVDRASMAVSLEAREPFLDHKAAEVAAALGMHWKIRGRQNKYILRRLLGRYLPSELFDRPKQGFSAPIAEWLRGPLRALLEDQLSAASVKRWGILDAIAVGEARDRFLADRNGAGSAAGMWILIQLQRWAGRWLPTPSG